jgi:hypothetical protein
MLNAEDGGSDGERRLGASGLTPPLILGGNVFGWTAIVPSRSSTRSSTAADG